MFRNGKQDLLKVKTTGQATPAVLKSNVDSDVPSWSPTGDAILCGNELLTPEGALIRTLGDHHSRNFAFSRDGKLLYGLREEGARELPVEGADDINLGTAAPIDEELEPGAGLVFANRPN